MIYLKESVEFVHSKLKNVKEKMTETIGRANKMENNYKKFKTSCLNYLDIKDDGTWVCLA